MPTPPTTAELQATLARIRARPGCANWPADIGAVLAHPTLGRLLCLEARFGQANHKPARSSGTAFRSRSAPRPVSVLDLKRAAAGDRDD